MINSPFKRKNDIDRFLVHGIANHIYTSAGESKFCMFYSHQWLTIIEDSMKNGDFIHNCLHI